MSKKLQQTTDDNPPPVELDFLEEVALQLREEYRAAMRGRHSRLDVVVSTYMALQAERATWLLEEIRDTLKESKR